VALSRVQTVITYSSSGGNQTYYWDVVIDAQGLCTLKNVRGPSGDPCSYGIPEVVLLDMQESKDITAVLLGETEVASGTLIFTGQTELTEAILPGVLNNTDYRVVYTPPDSVQFRTEDLTTTSFKAVPSAAYGSGTDPKSVPYSVLVSTAASSTTGGTLSFVAADASTKTVTFPSAFATDAYRVVLTPSDFFPARVTTKSKTGFTVEIGIGLMGAETVDVGYDVFV